MFYSFFCHTVEPICLCHTEHGVKGVVGLPGFSGPTGDKGDKTVIDVDFSEVDFRNGIKGLQGQPVSKYYNKDEGRNNL